MYALVHQVKITFYYRSLLQMVVAVQVCDASKAAILLLAGNKNGCMYL
jgi:hypothetical protein